MNFRLARSVGEKLPGASVRLVPESCLVEAVSRGGARREHNLYIENTFYKEHVLSRTPGIVTRVTEP